MKKTIGIVLMVALIAGAVFSGVMCAKQYSDAKDSESTFCELQELIKDTAGSLSAEGTEVSAEADMGIGQLVFCSLADGTKQWADVIIQRAINHSRPEAEAVQAAFKNNGYDIRFSAQKLMELYG